MKFDNEVISRILHEYEETRSLNEQKRLKRINEVYTKIPRIKDIDDETRIIGSTTANAILLNPSQAAELRKKMRENFARLKSEKDVLLANAGFSNDYMNLHYTCDICKDTGYADNKRCKCFEQKLIDEAYTNSNLSAIIKDQNFSSFSFDYYSKNALENGISPYNRICDIYRIAVEFANNIEPYPKSLLFYGENGLGKTFLSSCIAKEVLDKGKTVVYTTATRLFSIYEDYKFNRKHDNGVIEKAYQCDLLIIDDLGAEYISKATIPFMFDLLNTRLLEGKKFIISSNHSVADLTEIYTKRFTSRIYEYFMPLEFLGTDIRVQKMINQK